MINKSKNILSWVEAAIAKQDLVTAEYLVKQTAPDCERIYALLMLVEAYEKDGKDKKVRSSALKATTLWRIGIAEWWAAPILGDILSMLSICNQRELASGLLTDGETLICDLENAWQKTHVWCGLAIGSIKLGKKVQGERYINKAIKMAKSRPTDEECLSALSIVDDTLSLLSSELDCDQSWLN